MITPTNEQVKQYAAKLSLSSKLSSIDEKALHVYRTSDGVPIYWRVRVKCLSSGEKWIRPFYWDGGKFITGEPPAPPEGKPLYALELLALHPAAMVIVVEGENKADAINKVAMQGGKENQIIAVTSGGASSAQATNWGLLTGRAVMVWPDNDDAGANYAADVVACLQGIAASVMVLNVAQFNLPHKGDAVDYFKAGGRMDGLMLAIESAQLVSGTASTESDLSGANNTGDMDVSPEIVTPADTPSAQSDDEIIQYLAKLKPLDYDRERKEKSVLLGVRPATLDGMVKAARNDESEAGRLPFVEVEPHPQPIDPAQLLDEVSDTILRFIVLDAEQAHAAALWCALTWLIDAVEVAPLAIINAPEKACGKTQLLTVIGRMAYRPLPASNASASALFRAVEAWKPSILIDEADTFFRDNAELHGMVNAGYLRDGFVLRSEAVGDSFEPRMFSVFSAKALAGIALEKHLPDATMSRGIVFNLRRKLSHESVSRLRHADRDLFAGIAEKLARFAADYSQQVRQARPILPDALSDRDQDNWDGLLAIASCAGDVWLARATSAALKLSGAGEKTQSTGNELLADIQHVFEIKKLDKISTADLIAALCADEELSWNTYNRGRQLSPKQLATRLKAYGIASKNIRLGTYETPKGFELSQFADAFLRYLSTPLNLPPHATKPLEANRDGVYSVAAHPPQNTIRHKAATLETTPLLGCGGVAGELPILEVSTQHKNASHLRI